jgi:prostaglandin-H2 D-isomerase / glutathione transferase
VVSDDFPTTDRAFLRAALTPGRAIPTTRGMPKYRLTYFDFSGSRGEECRLALHVAGIEFEDRRLARSEWSTLKPETPYGGVPLLEVEGRPPLAQSNVILGYIGRQYGLLPSDPWEAARHEAVVTAVEDLRVAMAPSAKIQDQEEKRRVREEFAATTMQTWARNTSRQIKGPFVGGEQISVADIKVANMLRTFASGTMDYIPTDVFAEYPKLAVLAKAVDAHPKVVDWRSRHS